MNLREIFTVHIINSTCFQEYTLYIFMVVFIIVSYLLFFVPCNWKKVLFFQSTFLCVYGYSFKLCQDLKKCFLISSTIISVRRSVLITLYVEGIVIYVNIFNICVFYQQACQARSIFRIISKIRQLSIFGKPI